MAKIKIVLNRAGVAELMRSEEMQGILAEYGEAVAGRAGEGFIGEAKVYKRRAAFNIKADTPKARAQNLKHNTLLKALGGGK